MTHRVLEIPGGSTRFENCPEVSFTGGGNTSVRITVTYRATEWTEDAAPRRGQLVFSDVLEFRWIEHDVGYEPYEQHRNDGNFGLIEILDSAYVETMAVHGGWRDHAGLRIRGQPEGRARHFRFCADDWGTLNIIATELEIREAEASPG
jgi:hypothetical protein